MIGGDSLEWTRLENESEEHLLMRLATHKDQIGTWDDIARIMNELTGKRHTESKYRRNFKEFQSLGLVEDVNSEFAFSDEQEIVPQVDTIAEKLRELEKAKIQYRDERNAWNKQNYLNARVEQDLNYLGEKLSAIGRVNFNVVPSPISVNSDNDLIVCLSDLHIGETFDSWFGKYDSDIAKERLNQYLDEIVKIGKRHNSENVFVSCLGDTVSGNIHLSIQVSNRENLIDQIKLSSEYIASFCVELSKHFKNVCLIGVAGNHSRCIADKNKDIKDERLDTLITWIVEQMTLHVSNISVLENEIDTGIASFGVRGNTFLGVHGDYDAMSDAGISKLVMAVGTMPYAILGGHRHTPAYREFNNIKFIQSGNLAGVGDDFTVSHRLTGKANQTVLVCNNKGIECIYNVELS